MKYLFFAVLAGVALAATRKAQSATMKSIDRAIKKASVRFGVRERLIRAIIRVESAFNPKARGSAGEVGLMQMKRVALMDANRYAGTAYSVNDLFNIEISVMMGTSYFAWLKNTWKLSEKDALRAYNQGIGRVLGSSTAGIEYANKVLRYA
jgi:soluble lytic murein transglycosylase-like protein